MRPSDPRHRPTGLTVQLSHARFPLVRGSHAPHAGTRSLRRTIHSAAGARHAPAADGPCVTGDSAVSCSSDALLAADQSSHSSDRQPGASQWHVGPLVTGLAGGDEPRRSCCSVGPAEQHDFATVLAPDGCLARRCRLVASESHDDTRSARAAFEPRTTRDARTVRGRRESRTGRGMVLCVSTAAARATERGA